MNDKCYQEFVYGEPSYVPSSRIDMSYNQSPNATETRVLTSPDPVIEICESL